MSETQLKLIPPEITLPHPPRHTGFMEPGHQEPGYTLEQMLEYGRARAIEAMKQSK